jgi:hypothetical protein
MSPAAELVESLRSEGVRVQLLHGTDLRVRAPQGILTEEHRELIRAHKAEIVALLTSYPCSLCGRFAFPRAGVVCFHCRGAA